MAICVMMMRRIGAGPAVDKSKIGRNSKSRAKGYERDIAKALGGKRYPADTGGPLDVLVPGFCGVQVKSGGNVVTEVIRKGIAEAVLGCALDGGSLTPLLAVVDRRGARNQAYIILRLSDWQDLHGGPHYPGLDDVDSNDNLGVE